MSNREAVIAVNRFGLGAAPGEFAEAASDPREWLPAQFKSVPEYPAFAAGGAVRGGRVITDWPGLSDRALHEERDLRPTLDLRALLKAALVAQVGVSEGALETRVFPESGGARAL